MLLQISMHELISTTYINPITERTVELKGCIVLLFILFETITLKSVRPLRCQITLQGFNTLKTVSVSLLLLSDCFMSCYLNEICPLRFQITIKALNLFSLVTPLCDMYCVKL